MGHRQESPQGSDGRAGSGVLFYALIGVLGLAFVATMTFVGTVLVGDSTDQRLERDRGEATRKATQIQNAYLSYQAERGEWPASVKDTLEAGRNGAPYLEGGQAALYDPWGKQFQVELLPDASGKPQPVVWTKDPQGRRVGFPAD